MVRDAKGKFVKGHEKTGGRKPRPVEERYLELIKKVVTPDDMREIIARAMADAKRGDSVARKWLADYLIGPPVQRQELTGSDGGALTIHIVNEEEE